MVEVLKSIEKVMEDHGFKRLGDGFHSTAYQCKNTKYTVKFFDGDPAYMSFLQLIKKHPNNPHFPRIICCRQLPNYPGVWMAKQEVLTPVPESEWQKLGLYYFNQYWINMSLFCFTSMSSKQRKAARHWLKKPEEESVLQALLILIDNKCSSHLDVKRENVMKRGDTYVFIDPFW